MNTITQRNWKVLREIRNELGLDKPSEEPAPPPRTHKFRLADGTLIEYDRDRPPIEIDAAPHPRRPVKYLPKAGELIMGEWVRDEAARTGYSLSTLRSRILDPAYQKRCKIVLRHVHKRLIYVTDYRPIKKKT